ncbi:MAG: hypothetical protein ACEPOV_13635 [Hyphomicrobiales bacterium]
MTRWLTYTNSFFTKDTRIKCQHEDLILLHRGMLSRNTSFCINNQDYWIKEEGIFSKNSYVYDSYGDPIAHIRFSALNRAAQVTYRENKFFWKLDSPIGSKWILHNNYRKIECVESFSKGSIYTDLDDDILISLGVYMGRQYYDMSNIFLMIIVIFLFLLQ